MNDFVSGMVSIALAIVGLAIISVLVSGKAQTSNVIQAASGGFAQDLVAAVSPVTGNAPSNFGQFSGGFHY